MLFKKHSFGVLLNLYYEVDIGWLADWLLQLFDKRMWWRGGGADC